MALQKSLDDNLPTSEVRRWCSAIGTPILFVRKKDGSLTLVVAYRALNRLTTLNKYLLPLISELLDITPGAKRFTILYLRMNSTLSESQQDMSGKQLCTRRKAYSSM